MKHLISQIFPDRLISLAAGQSQTKVGWQKFWYIDKGALVGRFAEVLPFGGIMTGRGSNLAEKIGNFVGRHIDFPKLK